MSCRPTVWFSGSGRAAKTRSYYRAISGKARAVRERRSRCSLAHCCREEVVHLRVRIDSLQAGKGVNV